MRKLSYSGQNVKSDIVRRIKDRWPLPAMLARLGINVPAKGKFHSPFRPDKNLSCELLGDKIRDWSTGENFDCIGCFAAAKGISNEEAIKQLASELPDARPQRAAPATPESRAL